MSKTVKIIIISSIIIVFFFLFGLINLLLEENGKKLSRVFWLFLIIGIYFICRAIWKSKNKKDIDFEQISNLNKTNVQNINTVLNEKSPSLKKEKELLLSSLDNNILTEQEYNEKLNQLELREQELINKYNVELKDNYDKKQKELFDIELQKRLQPALNQLVELKKSNILTESEFNNKISIINQQYNDDLQKEIDNNELILSDNFDKIRRKGLYFGEMGTFNRLQEQLNEGDVILKNKKSHIIEIKTKSQWNDLLISGDVSNYWLIIDA